MKAGRKPRMLTEKEAFIMNILWDSERPLYVREILEKYPEPRPHFNTVATTVRILEDKGYVAHEVVGGSHRFIAIASRDDFRARGLADLIRDYFSGSYKSAVSALVEEEKISVDELREIIDIIEKKGQ